MEWGGLFLFVLGGLVLAWWYRPPRCEECFRTLGPPTGEELAGGQPIGCPCCNLNLRPPAVRGRSVFWKPTEPPAPR